ncbi:MAG: hypothetical protein WCF43_06420 [Steroidobacteraceae bacterium]
MRSLWLSLGLLAALHLGTVRAEVASANLQVSVQVLPHVSLRADASPVSITPADVQRGYLDVSRHYQLQSNAPDRVVLQLNPRVGLTDAIDIDGFQAPLRMRDASLEIAQPFAREFTVNYRLWLSAGAMPGEYALPVQVAALIR